MLRRNFFRLFGIGAAAGVATAESASEGAFMVGNGDDVCKLVRALGLDPKKTRSVHLNIDVDDAVTVDVTQYVTDKELRKIAAVFEQEFYLTKKTNRICLLNAEGEHPLYDTEIFEKRVEQATKSLIQKGRV